ncbi:MAG: hypothetical protein ABJF10_16355 [Chthoniobacter sp.]|uniref:hypothetical protein n=1 Tax=Chthoniobacter sp. TaxID=2510640 RepID=UPI0032AD19EC
MKHTLFLCTLAFLGLSPAHAAPKADTLDDLKKLPITCLVPDWLPEGYHLKRVSIDYEDRDGLHDPKTRGFPSYNLDYRNGKKGQFTVECAREGIGDRNLDKDERAEESQFETKRYGTVYIIYFPPGKTGVKDRITANWIDDDAMQAEKTPDPAGPRIKGRYHGLSGYGMTVAQFEKIVQSVHPIREKAADTKTSK